MCTMITGSSGFVGLALTEHLLNQGETVVGFDRSAIPDYARKVFSSTPGTFIPTLGDVRDEEEIREVVRRYAPGRLVIMAAITPNQEREKSAARSIYDINVGGAISALSAAAEFNLEKVVFISSGAVYGDSGRTHTSLTEDTTPLKPETLYGMSKRAAEDALIRLADIYSMPLAVGRIGTCFGPWEQDTGVRDTLSAPLQTLSLARQSRTAILPREGTRDWLYVRDAAKAIATLLERPHWQHSHYNLGTNHQWSIAQLCDRLTTDYPEFKWRLASPQEASNVHFYSDYDRAPLDISRLAKECHFTPDYDLKNAITDYQQWIKESGEDLIDA